MQFNLVICGLDSVEARRWINATLVNLVDPENPESLKPLIDGGTEGQLRWTLQLRIFQPVSQVSRDKPVSFFPACRLVMSVLLTCSTSPRHSPSALLPIHRVFPNTALSGHPYSSGPEYTGVISFDNRAYRFPDIASEKKLDTDDPEHIGWLYTIASARAKEFKIEGVTWSLAQGVVKNVIPAIASTNAIIAGALVCWGCFPPFRHDFSIML